MSSLASIIFILIIHSDFVAVMKLHQSGAVVTVCDPAYVTNCKAITRRVRRNEPYLTNITATALRPFSNNVTMIIAFSPEIYGETLMLQIKTCEVTKVKWLEEYMRKYSNVPITCPVPPGNYQILNMEIPPKDFPLVLPNKVLNLRLIMELTDTKHKIWQCEMKLY